MITSDNRLLNLKTTRLEGVDLARFRQALAILGCLPIATQWDYAQNCGIVTVWCAAFESIRVGQMLPVGYLEIEGSEDVKRARIVLARGGYMAWHNAPEIDTPNNGA